MLTMIGLSREPKMIIIFVALESVYSVLCVPVWLSVRWHITHTELPFELRDRET